MQEYHTAKEPIIVREFGRNFQKMILFAKALPDRERRQAAIDKIVEMILEMYPVNNRNVDDYKLKIWSHILQICDYELDVETPDNIPPKKEAKKPEQVPYPSGGIRYKHYGKGIQRLLEKASQIEDPEVKEELIKVTGAFMKMCYKNWNRDNASDDVVAQEMKILSGGEIHLDEATNINFLIQPQFKAQGANNTHHVQKKNNLKQQYRKPGNHNFKKNPGNANNKFKGNHPQNQAKNNPNFKKKK
jgi:hypothetical protein